MTVEAVLFDFGGVFTDSPFAAAAGVAKELGTSPDVLLATIFGPYHDDTDHPWHCLERGELTLEEARDRIVELGRLQGIDADPFHVFGAFSAGTMARDSVVDHVRRLRARDFKIAMVTNNVQEFRDGWRAMIPDVEDLFDAVIDSSEAGVRKPDPAIFRLALEALGGVAPERAVFLDDFDGNVAAASALGIVGIHVGPDPEPALARLRELTKI